MTTREARKKRWKARRPMRQSSLISEAGIVSFLSRWRMSEMQSRALGVACTTQSYNEAGRGFAGG